MPLTDEQRALRRSGIGGSDVATILGINPYQSAFELYFEKRGEIEDDDEETVNQRMGNRLEEPIAQEYAHQFGVKLRRRNKTFHHPEYPWLMAHIDRDIVGVRRGLEIKNVGWALAPKWGPSGTDEVADYYIPQPMHYMLVLDYTEWDVAAWIGGQELRTYRLERDPEWDDIIIEATHEFWNEHVLKGVPPEPDFSTSTGRAALRRVYPGTDGSTVELPEELEKWDGVYQESKDWEKRYREAAETAKAHILYHMGEAAVGRFPDGSYWERKEQRRRGYTVEPTSFLATNRKNPPKGK